MTDKLRSMAGLWIPLKLYLQNSNEWMNSVFEPAGSTKCKDFSKVSSERLRTIVKEQ